MNEHKKMPGTVGTVTEQSTKDNIRIPQQGLHCKLMDEACKAEGVAALLDTMQNLCGIFESYIISCIGISPAHQKEIAADMLPDVLSMLETIQALAENAENEAKGNGERLYQLLREVAE